MPSQQDAPATPIPSATQPPPAQATACPAGWPAQARIALTPVDPRQQALRLAEASRALWSATLSLMTAFMQNTAPAHRYLLARRISRNFDTLSRQDCFDTRCRASFARLTRRWHQHAEQCAPAVAPPAPGLLRLFS